MGGLALEQDLQLLRDLPPKRLTQLAMLMAIIPVGKQGRAISGDDDDALLVGTVLTRSMDQRLAEQQRGAGRGHDLMDQTAVFVRYLDEFLGRHVDLVAARDHYRASVIRTKVSQVRERFNEVAVKKAVVRVAGEGDIRAPVEAVLWRLVAALGGVAAVDVGIHLDDAGLAAYQFLCHRHHEGVGRVRSDDRCRLNDVGHIMVVGFVDHNKGVAHPWPRCGGIVKLLQLISEPIQGIFDAGHLRRFQRVLYDHICAGVKGGNGRSKVRLSFIRSVIVSILFSRPGDPVILLKLEVSSVRTDEADGRPDEPASGVLTLIAA